MANKQKRPGSMNLDKLKKFALAEKVLQDGGNSQFLAQHRNGETPSYVPPQELLAEAEPAVVSPNPASEPVVAAEQPAVVMAPAPASPEAAEQPAVVIAPAAASPEAAALSSTMAPAPLAASPVPEIVQPTTPVATSPAVAVPSVQPQAAVPTVEAQPSAPAQMQPPAPGPEVPPTPVAAPAPVVVAPAVAAPPTITAGAATAQAPAPLQPHLPAPVAAQPAPVQPVGVNMPPPSPQPQHTQQQQTAAPEKQMQESAGSLEKRVLIDRDFGIYHDNDAPYESVRIMVDVPLRVGGSRVRRGPDLNMDIRRAQTSTLGEGKSVRTESLSVSVNDSLDVDRLRALFAANGQTVNRSEIYRMGVALLREIPEESLMKLNALVHSLTLGRRKK